MSFRTRLFAAKGTIYLAGFIVLLPLQFVNQYAIFATLVWLIQKPRLVHRHILPMLFTHVRCTNGACGCLIPLVQRYKLAQYNHNQPEHVLRVRDTDGREVLSIDCPKADCQTTIPVQKGTDCRLVRATINGNAFAISVGEAGPARWKELWRWLRRGVRREPGLLFPLGTNLDDRPGRLVRLWRWWRKQPSKQVVHIPLSDLLRHGAAWGASGMGKSTLIEIEMDWIMRNGMGATVIDASGRLINQILRLVPEERKDDVLLIRAKNRDCPFQLNALDAKDAMALMNLKGELLQTIKAVSDNWGGDIALNIERAIETAKLVHGSLQDMFDLLTKQSARDRIVGQIDDEELIEFWHGWDRLSVKSQTPTVRKIRTMMKHPILGPMLGAKESNFDPDEAIRESKIVLVDLDCESDTDEVNIILGNIIAGKIRGAAARVKDGEEVPHFLIIDEASDFVHPGMKLSKILSKARKKKLSLQLASQHISQLRDVNDSIFGNAAVMVSFAVDIDDAKKFAERMTDVTADDIMNQEVGECIARIHRTTYRVKTTLPTLPETDQTEYIEEKMRALSTTRKVEDKHTNFSVALNAKVVRHDNLVCERVQ